MVIGSRSELDDLVREDRVHGRIYTDPEIFELEMERIFGRTWVYVAHESEVAQGGDYKTAYIGRQPVIVTRSADGGAIQVLYNRCRHRGAAVCQFEKGNASYFRCAYHGWTYSNRGDLIGVTYRQGYGPEFDYKEMGLTPVARTASYRGFIFASLSPDVPSLEEWLGNARPYIDRAIAQSPSGDISLSGGAQKYSANCNWKLQLENSADNYHVAFVHQSLRDLLAKRAATAKEGVPYAFTDARFADSFVRDLGNGHTVNDRPSGQSLVNTHEYSSDAKRYLERLAGRIGTGEANQLAHQCSPVPFTFNIFPSVVVLGTFVRTLRPISPTRTELAIYPIMIKDAPDEINAMRLRHQEQGFGPAGFVGPDDAEILERVQEGLGAKGNEWILQARNMIDEQMDDKGIRSGHLVGETGLRGFYRAWKRLMSV